MIDPKLVEYANTARQREILNTLLVYGSNRKTALALGIHHAAVDSAVASAKLRAAKAGYSPDHDMTHTVPPGFQTKGVSTYYDSEGQVRGQWVKSTQDSEARIEAMRAAAEAMAEELPRVDPLEPPEHPNEKLATLYTFTDSHVGMLAWNKEGGDDWDLKIAEKTLVDCFTRMVAASPSSGLGIINQLGDFLHSDGLLPVTPTSGHILDQDGRFSKMVAVAIRVLRRIVDAALMKHGRVMVVMAEGNHDMASSVWLRHMFKALYENEPRLTVVDSELPYYAIQFGKTMLAIHHGHLKKPDQLPMVFAAQYPVIWGNTTHRYGHSGHMHHEYVKEHAGMLWTQHRTLAARDAYASRGGYFSERDAKAITYHSEYGRVGEITISPEMCEGD